MTEKEELALAILLWRSMRAGFDHPGLVTNVVRDNETVTEQAEAMAIRVGVKDEFFQLLIVLPVLDIEVKNLDNEGKRKPRKYRTRRKYGG